MRSGPWLPGPQPERVDRLMSDGQADHARSSDELLPWAWAVERLERSRNYWVATATAAGVTHLAAVRGVWVGGALYFSIDETSATAQHLVASARCVIAPEGAEESVVVQGVAERVGDVAAVDYVRRRHIEKYEAGFPDPVDQPLFGIAPRVVIGAISGPDGSPESATRWRFSTIDE